VKRLLSVLMLVAMGFSIFVGTASAESRSASLDGRLGGDQKSFEAQFGTTSGQNDKIHGLDYAIDGFGAATVLYRSDVVVSITVTADRIAH
jgi:hypothetical protein